MTRPQAVIIDRDGTTASVYHTRPIDSSDASWANFNASLPFDAIVPEVVGLVRAIRPGVTRIMTSGRAEGDWPGDRRRRFAMQDWIDKYDLPIDHLFMRAGGDHRQDSIVKLEILDTLILPYWDVVYAFDDRPQVADAWRSRGIPVLQVTDPQIIPPIFEQTDRRHHADS